MKAEINAAVKTLSHADSDKLYADLGAYSMGFAQDPAKFAAPGAAVAIDADVAGPLGDAIDLGKRILRRWNKTIFDLVCTKSKDDADARNTILNALKLNSPEALATAITTVLIGFFSVAPAIAAIVGVLFGKLLLPAAGQEACAFWKEKLD